jgi:hypothetical protein
MSRARDQAWLFHSVQENDLGPNCLRRRVLEFFKQPPDLSIHGSSVDIPTLQLVSRRADRMAERPPRPFDSWFEVDVALALAIQSEVRLSARALREELQNDIDNARLRAAAIVQEVKETYERPLAYRDIIIMALAILLALLIGFALGRVHLR